MINPCNYPKWKFSRLDFAGDYEAQYTRWHIEQKTSEAVIWFSPLPKGPWLEALRFPITVETWLNS